MHWSTITMLFAATVLGVPAPVLVKRELSILPEQIQQGDGFYLAVFDEAGVTSVAFTPKAELLTRRASVSTSENVAARTVSTLSKRETVYHGRTSNVGDLDWANGELANHANNKWFDARTWAWVHNRAETSFICNYERNYITYNLIAEMHSVINNACQGSTAYGYDHRRHGGGTNDFVVGRTFNGDHFCDSSYHS